MVELDKSCFVRHSLQGGFAFRCQLQTSWIKMQDNSRKLNNMNIWLDFAKSIIQMKPPYVVRDVHGSCRRWLWWSHGLAFVLAETGLYR